MDGCGMSGLTVDLTLGELDTIGTALLMLTKGDPNGPISAEAAAVLDRLLALRFEHVYLS